MKFKCPHCNQKIEADDSFAGEEVNCPRCNGKFTMPSAAPPEFGVCPQCGNTLTAPDPVICVNCGHRFRELPISDKQTGDRDSDPEERRLWLLALVYFIGGLLCFALSVTPIAATLERTLTFMPVRSVRATLWLAGFGCLAMTYRMMPVKTITRHYMDWMGFCGKYSAILTAIIGAGIGYRWKAGRLPPGAGSLEQNSHMVECIVIGIGGAIAGFFVGAILGIIIGIIVAKFTRPGSSPG